MRVELPIVTAARDLHAGHGDPSRLLAVFRDSVFFLAKRPTAQQILTGTQSWIYMWSTFGAMASHCGLVDYYSALGADVLDNIVPTMVATFPAGRFAGLYLDPDSPHWISFPILRHVTVVSMGVAPIRSRKAHPGVDQ